MVTAEEIIRFWIDETGPSGWYSGGEDLDSEIRRRFLAQWQEAREGACGLWLTNPVGTLAYIILTDQFPRNMFRNQADAFATDPQARAAAKIAIGRDWDLAVPVEPRQFFYLPLEHSENLIDQDRAVRLIHSRMGDQGAGTLLHAKAHRAIIRKFGRFPFRNKALGRETSAAEQAWMDAGGYGFELRQLQETTG